MISEDQNPSITVEEHLAIDTLQRGISWGAVFAGLALFFALTWLLLLLGAAIGVSIADATDLEAMGDGLGIGAIAWLLMTSLVATFVGAATAAKLSGSPIERIGALHGLTVWSAATVLMLLLGVAGMGKAVSAVSGIVQSAANVGANVGNVVVTQTNTDEAASGLPDQVVNTVAAVIKRQSARLIAGQAQGVESDEIQQAIADLSSDDAAAVIDALASGNTEQAKQTLAARTELSESDIEAIVNGVEARASEWNESIPAQKWLANGVENLKSETAQMGSELGGAQVSQAEMRAALEDLDADVLGQAAQYLIMGEPEAAKDVLAVQTSLSESQINAIVDGAEQKVDKLVQQARRKVNEATETAGAYAQATSWTVFIAGLLGLAAGLVGGYAGAGTVRRVYPSHR